MREKIGKIIKIWLINLKFDIGLVSIKCILLSHIFLDTLTTEIRTQPFPFLHPSLYPLSPSVECRHPAALRPGGYPDSAGDQWNCRWSASGETRVGCDNCGSSFESVSSAAVATRVRTYHLEHFLQVCRYICKIIHRCVFNSTPLCRKWENKVYIL